MEKYNHKKIEAKWPTHKTLCGTTKCEFNEISKL